MKLSDVLQKISAANRIDSQAELGRLLGIDKRRISDYMKNARTPTDEEYALIAMAADMRMDELQALVKLASETDEKSREVWKKYYKSIGGIAASALLSLAFALALNFATPTPAQAAPVKAETSEPVCIMSSRKCERNSKKAQLFRAFKSFMDSLQAIFTPRIAQV